MGVEETQTVKEMKTLGAGARSHRPHSFGQIFVSAFLISVISVTNTQSTFLLFFKKLYFRCILFFSYQSLSPYHLYPLSWKNPKA